MKRSELEEVVQRWAEAVARGGPEAFEALVDPTQVDLAGIQARAAALRAGLADLEVRPEELLCEEDRVCWRWSATGTHVGVFLGVPPTGTSITVHGINVQRVERQRVVDHWTMVDAFRALKDLKAASP